jgi:hypothetical protein
MKLKLDENGKPVFGANGLPVYVNDDGSDYGEFDAKSTLATIKTRNAEAKAHREAKEAAEQRLQSFGDLDPEAARKAIEITSNLDAKKLVDAGHVEKLKADINSAWETRFKEVETKANTLQEQLTQRTLGAAFAGSKFISDRTTVPHDFMQAAFAKHFKVEGDRLIAVDSEGHTVTSKRNPGKEADFDEALEILAEAHPRKDSFLRSAQAGGNGTAADGGNGSAGNTRYDASKLGGTREERQAALAAKFGLPVT